MGQKHTRGNQSTQDVKHSKFHKVSYPIQIFDKQVQTMEVELPCDQTSYKKWKQDLKIHQKQFSNKKYLLLPEEYDYKGSGLCSQSGTVKITYPKLPYLLQDQILSVQSKKNTFSEPQVWKLLYIITSAKYEFLDLAKNFSFDLGNINPKNILLNQHSQAKVVNPLSWPNYIDGYKSAILKESSYLSPQDMKLLELGALNNDSNINSEQFSTGMTLLSVGLVENLQNLYNFDKNVIKMKQFEQKIMFWKTTLYYSEILRAVILCLLQIDPKKRLTLKQVNEFLKPHASNIEAQKPLKINNANSKLNAEVDKLRKQLPDLIKYRFQKYAPQKQKQSKQTKSLPKQSKNNSLPKQGKISKIESPPKQVSKISIPKQIKINNQRIDRFQPNPSILILNAGTNSQQQTSLITRVKSQTRFTYSNRPLEGVSPVKFVVANQNINVNQQSQSQSVKGQNKIITTNPAQSSPLIQETNIISSIKINNNINENKSQTNLPIQENYTVESNDYMKQAIKPHPAPHKPGDLIDEILQPRIQKAQSQQQKAQNIAQRLVDHGLKHTDSEIQVQQSNRQSATTEINKLERLQGASPIASMKASFQQKDNFIYHTYVELLIQSDFESAWNQFLEMIHKPDSYFSELDHKITLTDQQIQIPPGRVKLQTNKEEGKIHLENVSSSCKGQILGGVSKNSPNEVQVWFNSSYSHDDKPFPTSEYFLKSLQKLKLKLESKSK